MKDMETVLFVDDEKGILNALRRSLRHESYNKIFVETSEGALDIIRNNEVAVIVSDLGLPDIDGVKLLKIVEENDPQIYKIALTGKDDLNEIYQIFEHVDLFKYITKPWNVENMKAYIHEALDLYVANKKK